jgi:hypothetical protein
MHYLYLGVYMVWVFVGWFANRRDQSPPKRKGEKKKPPDFNTPLYNQLIQLTTGTHHGHLIRVCVSILELFPGSKRMEIWLTELGALWVWWVLLEMVQESNNCQFSCNQNQFDKIHQFDKIFIEWVSFLKSNVILLLEILCNNTKVHCTRHS